MSVKKIYLIRHGQTEFNEQGVVQGRGVDASLNDLGKSQAEMFYNAYKELPFETVYTSSLKRSQESVAAFIDDGIPHEIHPGLDEISWGRHEGAKASEERDRYFRRIVTEWRSGNTARKIGGGESPDDVALRQKPIIERLVNAPESLILVCMHGRALKIMVSQMLNKPISEMDDFNHSNLGLYVLHYNGKFELLKSNNVEHLQS
ncbi:MAG: histidine phosphatase family protein [Bacteroidota bacterium]